MQEKLLPSFADQLISLIINDDKLFDRKEHGRFPEIKELKQLVRDRVDPDRDLGHSDKPL